MYPLNLPPFELKLIKRNGSVYIYDTLRRKYVRLTPEEWVRQHFVNFLIKEKGYPQGLLANEVSVGNGRRALRSDTVVYGNDGKAVMAVEYKSPEIAITQAVFDQVCTYCMSLHVNYVVVSNGLEHFCCKITGTPSGCEFIDHIPEYREVASPLHL